MYINITTYTNNAMNNFIHPPQSLRVNLIYLPFYLIIMMIVYIVFMIINGISYLYINEE